MKTLTAKYTKSENAISIIIQRVLDNLENNPAFPTLPEAYGILKKMYPEWQVALANAQGRDKHMVSIKNDLKASLQGSLGELGDYVTITAKGDRTLILSSGFDVTERRNSKQLPSIEKLEVVLGLPGEVTTIVKNVTGIKAYIHQYTTEQPGINTVWVQEGSSSGNHTFTGLASEKRYWFRVIAIGFNKQKALSPVISRVIQ